MAVCRLCWQPGNLSVCLCVCVSLCVCVCVCVHACVCVVYACMCGTCMIVYSFQLSKGSKGRYGGMSMHAF